MNLLLIERTETTVVIGYHNILAILQARAATPTSDEGKPFATRDNQRLSVVYLCNRSSPPGVSATLTEPPTHPNIGSATRLHISG